MKKAWEFENGVIVVEGNNFCGFDVYADNYERFLGSICIDIDELESCVKDLNNGIDPISGGWENGGGETCTLDGWEN